METFAAWGAPKRGSEYILRRPIYFRVVWRHAVERKKGGAGGTMRSLYCIRNQTEVAMATEKPKGKTRQHAAK